MVKRKSTPKKKTRRKSRKNKLFKGSLARALGGLIILLVVVVVAGLLAHFLIPPRKPAKTERPFETIPQPKPSIAKIPTFEIYPLKEIPAEKKPLKTRPPGKTQLPRVAIIIDDLGYDKKIAEKLSRLSDSLTFSILPHSPQQKSIARLAHEKGMGTMLHLPMEPIEYPAVNPGPGTLLTSMTPDQLIRKLETNLAAVPYINGVNNHMGSKMTADSSQMYQIFSILKKKNLFFIDSRTTSKSLCKPSARLFQIPFAQRDVFLDHFQDPDFIRRQIKELIRIAQRNGQAVGIGHPHTMTYDILREMMPELEKKVNLVPASEIVHPVG